MSFGLGDFLFIKFFPVISMAIGGAICGALMETHDMMMDGIKKNMNPLDVCLNGFEGTLLGLASGAIIGVFCPVLLIMLFPHIIYYFYLKRN
jgi:hypothetical protein